MSSMWPFLPGGTQGEWNICPPEEQISRSREKCPICRNVLTELFGDIGGFPDHEHVHPGSLTGYNCYECMRHFSLDEMLLIKEKKMQKEVLVRNYWQGVHVVLRNPYLYLIIVACMILGRGFWAGIMAGIVISFLLPLLMIDRKKIFAPLGRLARKALLPDKPPDSPSTP